MRGARRRAPRAVQAVTVPPVLLQALETAEKLGVVQDAVDAIVHLVNGDAVEARLSAETGAIKAAARAPYRLKERGA